jgi:sulfur oxidation c-type cytochrome SoxX
MKRVHIEILAGTILILLSSVILIVMAFREPQRMADYELEQAAAQIEFGAGVYESNCTRCHGTSAQGIPGLAPSLRDEAFFTERLDEVGWEGSLRDYIVSVVTIGRQVSTRPSEYVGGGSPAMPTWSDKFDGPLRDDQIRAVAAYIMNFEAYAIGLVPTPVPLVSVEDESDPVALGLAAFNAAGCVACHTISGISAGTVGPVLDGIASRAGSAVAGLNAEDYIRESIVDPNAFMVEGFTAGIMLQTFGESLTEEQIENLITFLLTLE